MDSITIPILIQPVQAAVTVPGSKSITNRALLIAALAGGSSTIRNALFSEDTEIFSNCLRQLGIDVASDHGARTIQVVGQGGEIPIKSAELFVGNAGTAARFITAYLALAKGTYALDGVPAMRQRPMGNLLGVLEQFGAAVTYGQLEGHFPFQLQTTGFGGGHIKIRGDQSSQHITALLLVAPYAQQETVIEIEGELVSKPYIHTTLQMMAAWGAEVQADGMERFIVPAGQRYQPREYVVEPDASSASYFFAAAAVTGSRIRINHLSRASLQGDTRLVELLAQMGCQVESGADYIEVTGPAELQGLDVDMNDISDTVPTLAAIAPFAGSPTRIRNVEHIRWKETDRVHAVVTELRRMGIIVDEYPDGLTIHPGAPKPAEIETYNDHRIAMAFAVTGLRSPGIVITNPGCTVKTFPEFFDYFFDTFHLATEQQ
jgi:3-phosphoshikimate 1-carboxyvinyltransferase